MVDATVGDFPIKSLDNQVIEEKKSEWNLKLNNLSPTGRCAAMFRNQLLSDVCFRVGPRNAYQVKAPAHKFILATASPVFYAMLYGPLAEEGEIEIPDIEPDSFMAMLKFLYTNQLDVQPRLVASVMYCAKKYLLSDLTNASFQYLEKNLTDENALLVLNQSILLDEKNVTELCLEKIDIPAVAILNSDEFVDIQVETLKTIISRQTLNADEIKVFEASWRWAKAECRRRMQVETGENCRSALGDALFLIRFPIIPQKEFAVGPAKSGLLTDDEINDIYAFYTADTMPESWFPTAPRSLAECHECVLLETYNPKFDCAGNETFQFKVDKRIFMAGLGIYSGLYPDAPVQVKCELKISEKVLQTLDVLYEYPGSLEGQPIKVLFPSPVCIEADTFYTLALYLPTKMHINYLNSKGVQANSVTFEFASHPDSSFDLADGIIESIFFYGPL